MDRVTLPTIILHGEVVVMFSLTVHPTYFLFSFRLPCVTHRKPDFGGEVCYRVDAPYMSGQFRHYVILDSGLTI